MSGETRKSEVGRRTQSCVFGFERKSPESSEKAGYVGCATWVIPCGVSSIPVFSRRLAVSHTEHEFEGARPSAPRIPPASQLAFGSGDIPLR